MSNLGRRGATTPNLPGDIKHCGNGPGKKYQAGRAKVVEANDNYAKGQTQEALAVEEGQPSPPAKTKRQRPGRMLLSQAQRETGEKNAYSF